MIAFQSGAFQATAFQLSLVVAAAFQPGAFQNDAFQTDTTTAEEQRYVPGHRHYVGPRQRHRTDAERRERRIELGILPAPVQKAVEKAVRRVINKAKAEERTQPQGVNPLIWLRQHHAQEQQALAYDLSKRALSFDIRYMALVRLEVERVAIEAARIEQEREDEMILTLLMEL